MASYFWTREPEQDQLLIMLGERVDNMLMGTDMCCPAHMGGFLVQSSLNRGSFLVNFP